MVAVPLTSFRSERQLDPSRVLLMAPDGGPTSDPIALCEQGRTLAKGRLPQRRGTPTLEALDQIEDALVVALDPYR